MPGAAAPAQHQLATLTEEDAGSPSRGFSALVDQIRAEFVDADCHTLILSAEDFCQLRHPNVLTEAFPAFRTEVFLSLRPQYDILSPFYYTAVGMRKTTLSPDEFLEAHLRSFLNYQAMLERWRKACPDAEFHVRRYERGSPARTNSVADFIEVLGLPLSPDESSSESRHHATLPARGTLALRSLATMGYSDVQFWKFYQALRRNRDLLGQEMSVYSPARRLEVHETYRESNRRVRAEFIDGKAEDLFDDPEIDNPEQWLAEFGDTTAVLRDLLFRFAERTAPIAARKEA